jgi:peptidoglycan hydrolase-like protein with peptidoglycan-binding domain
MILKRIATSCLAVSLVMGPTGPARADGDAIVGGIIGGIIGGAIVNESNKKRRVVTTRSSSRSTVSSAQREANREVQVALNHFGFNVGTPDGAIGPRSRSAISEYQATLGYPATGQLTDYERNHLVGSYHRAVAGGALTMQQAAANPMGMRGLLVTWRDEAAGVTAPVAAAVAPAAPAPVPAAPVLEAATPAPETEDGALPSFLGSAGGSQASLASHCNKVGLMTSTNGGYTTLASMTDPLEVLGEQFCLARGYAIAQGEDMAARVPGFTPEQIAAQCMGFGPAMKAQVAELSLRPAADVEGEVQKFALSSGMAPAQLAATAKICLSVGYRTDNMDVAVASALLLSTLGEGAYGELLGHHLSQGFGATQRPDLALAWYEKGLAASAAPGAAVFAPGQPERNDLIRTAAYMAGGRADPAALPEAVPAALPTFNLAPADAAPGADATSGN